MFHVQHQLMHHIQRRSHVVKLHSKDVQISIFPFLVNGKIRKSPLLYLGYFYAVQILDLFFGY
jgi:hypothetical protein